MKQGALARQTMHEIEFVSCMSGEKVQNGQDWAMTVILKVAETSGASLA